MAFALIFTIVLAIVLLGGAIIIGKSSLPTNEKLTSLIVIMGLFALVSIVNEVKRASVVKPASNIIRTVDFQKGFFKLPAFPHEANFRFPLLEDPRDLVNSTLGDWDPSKLTNLQLAFLYTDRKEETSIAFKEYTRYLQEEGTPALYVQLPSPDFGVFDLASSLKLPSVDSIDETIKKLNKEGKVANIFIDDAQNAFTYDETLGNGFVCAICKYLVSLYDSHKANVVMISNDAKAREYLRADPAFSSKVNFFNLKERSPKEIENYLVQNINPEISEANKQFNTENINLLLHTLGWNPAFVEDYLQNIKDYQSVEQFARTKLRQQANRVSGFSDLWDFISPLLSLTEEKGDNAWFSYAQIRKSFEGNPSKKLDDAINAHLIIKEKNLYRFSNTTLYNALLLAKGGKK